ncbi:isopentenyl-diphosphate delta-isomerase [Halodesulfovibrio aestuarii]|nr:isopentenyl-diphosphate delta-isomerase [Halodesulfovibrio aestuarii]
MVVPSATAHAQRLAMKSVFVFIYNKQGKFFLQRRADNKTLAPGMWDISAATHVAANEALEASAERVLLKELNLTSISLHYKNSQQVRIDDATLWSSIYSANIGARTITPNPEEVQDGLYVDAEELQSLYEHFPDLLTSILKWAIRENIIFTDSI